MMLWSFWSTSSFDQLIRWEFCDISRPETATPPASPSDRSADEKVVSSDAPKPWLPMLLALVALCVSLGANVYLGWLAWQERTRSRGLLEELHVAGG